MKRKLKALTLCAIIIAAISILTACTEQVMWSGNSYPGNMDASFKYFNGPQDMPFKLNEGDTVTFTYDSKVDKGSLSIKIVDPDNKTVKELPSNQKGTEEIKAEKGGNYKVIITGNKTSGSYDVKWKITK